MDVARRPHWASLIQRLHPFQLNCGTLWLSASERMRQGIGYKSTEADEKKT